MDAYIIQSAKAADSYASLALNMTPLLVVILGIVIAGVEIRSYWRVLRKECDQQ